MVSLASRSLILLCLLSVALLVFPGGRPLAASPPTARTGGWPLLDLKPAVQGLARPLVITHAGDGSGRLFVAEQHGIVRVVRGGAVEDTPFIDLTDRVKFDSYDQGLLGLAFPPGYEQSGAFYIGYTNHNGDTVVSRFRVTSDPEVADASSEEILLVFEQQYRISIHNGGRLAFSPRDGYLYIANGDGGFDDIAVGDPANNAQNPLSMLGKILRIDVESVQESYLIPPTNPFHHRLDYHPEIWATGLRNPWSISFDSVTGDLYIADVGNTRLEEINFQRASSGGGENYGWRIMEGTGCHAPVIGCLPPSNHHPPVAVYSHADGSCAVIGGHVYRGDAYPALQGVYLYGDWCTGIIRGLRQGEEGWQERVLYDASFGISTFGQDEEGRLYLADYESGTLYELTSPGVMEPIPMHLPLLLR